MNVPPFDHEPRKAWLFSKASVVACVVVAVIGFLLLTGHRAHLFGALPYLLLLACPLMHNFMHGGHRDHAHHANGEGETTGVNPTEKPVATKKGGR